MFCKHCNNLMRKVMRFENGKSYKFYRCPNCYRETKPRRFFFEHKEISKRKTQVNKLRNQ